MTLWFSDLAGEGEVANPGGKYGPKPLKKWTPKNKANTSMTAQNLVSDKCHGEINNSERFQVENKIDGLDVCIKHWSSLGDERAGLASL